MTASRGTATRPGRAAHKLAVAVLGVVLLAGCQVDLPEPWPTPTAEPVRPEPVVGSTWSNLTPVNGTCLGNDSWDLTSEEPHLRLEPVDCADKRALFTIRDVGAETCTNETGEFQFDRKETQSGVGYCVGAILAPGRCFPYRADVAPADPEDSGAVYSAPIPCDAGRLPPVDRGDRAPETWTDKIIRVTSDRMSGDDISKLCRGKMSMSSKSSGVGWCIELLPLGGT
jgi:hypothetical protein